MSQVGLLRLKLFVAQHGPILALGFALVGVLLLGAAGWEYSTPPTTEVTDHTNKQTIRSELHTHATTTGNTSLYGSGRTLVDQPVYLLASAPSITLTQRTTLPAGQPVHVEQDVTIRYYVAHDGTTFWEESHVLVQNETTTSTGEVVTKTSLDMSTVQSRLNEITAEVGQAGTIQAQLVVTLSYETNRYTGELSETVPVQLTDSWYSIDAAPLERTHSTPVQRSVPIPTRDPLGYLIPGGIGGLLLIAAGGIAINYPRGFNQRQLEQRIHELRYTEWISTGSVPNPLGERTVSIDSLEGLVDTAIDTESRVIHDENQQVYIVIDGGVVYYYSPDGFLFTSPN